MREKKKVCGNHLQYIFSAYSAYIRCKYSGLRPKWAAQPLMKCYSMPQRMLQHAVPLRCRRLACPGAAPGSRLGAVATVATAQVPYRVLDARVRLYATDAFGLRTCILFGERLEIGNPGFHICTDSCCVALYTAS